MVMYDNEFKTKENKIWTKDEIEPQHTHSVFSAFNEIVCRQLLLLAAIKGQYTSKNDF